MTGKVTRFSATTAARLEKVRRALEAPGTSALAMLRLVLQVSPGRIFVAVAFLTVGGLAEGASLATFLPMLGLLSVDSGGDTNPVLDLFAGVFDALNFHPSMVSLLGAIIGFFWLRSAMLFLAQAQIARTAARFATEVRNELLLALLGARWDFLRNKQPGTIANAMSNEATMLSNTVIQAFDVLASLILVSIYWVLAALISWQMTLTGLVGGGLLWAALRYFMTMARRSGAIRAAASTAVSARLVDHLGAIKGVKAMARGEAYAGMIHAETLRLQYGYQLHVLSKAFLQALGEPLLLTVAAAVAVIAIAFFDLAIAQVLVAGLVLHRAAMSVLKVQQKLQVMVGSEAFVLSLLNQIQSARTAIEPARGTGAPDFREAIVFDDVSFRYGEGPLVMTDVSLRIDANRLTTLYGPSGSGKTTLCDMLLGFCAPERGAIRIDGLDFQTLDLERWRSQIGYVPQDITLFNDTLLANITLRNPHLSEADAETALRRAGAWEFVLTLEQGLHTDLGERAQRLSGGQRQRVALARALVHRPQLLILDEPTTALDPVTEEAVCATLRDLASSMTIVAISHQPSLANVADRTYRMASGRVSDTTAERVGPGVTRVARSAAS